ncbi:MAG: TlpA family protein disulfide reductase [Actinomycetota bacterium]
MSRLVAVLLAGAVALAGCSTSDSLSQQARAGDSKNYVSGDGTVSTVPAAEREEPVELAGTTAEGDQVDVAAWRGDVVVLNVWYAACAPCRAEAPDLAEVSAEYADRGVRFLGINTRDDAAGAQAFQRTYGIEYPSVLDATSGAALLSLRGKVPPQAVPTTLVLDAEGRVAARALGRIDGSTLRGLLDDVLAEEGPA